MEFQKYFVQSAPISTGQVFIDSLTGLTFGIRNITYDRLAFGSLTLPNAASQEIINVNPGQKWNFSFEGKEYELILLELNYLYDSYKVQLSEK
ncbi:MAG: hypothetical protein EHM93_12175 [Bacteroidales bacterium]|nr:MAG: hypothetical protein EHM93_12175 [Bacteroidales bacterium]